MFRPVRRPLVAAAAVLGSVFPAAAQAAPPPSELPWLHVAHPAGQRPVIVDARGRTVILHGVNVVGVEDDFYTTDSGQEPGPTPIHPIDPAAYAGTCPPMSHHAGEAPVCEVDAAKPEYAQSSAASSRNDFAQMRALGFNIVRLGVSWSQLEPTPGTYSRMYIDRIAQVVGWARRQGVYVLLDMHQDNYSRFTPETAPISVPPLLTPSQEGSAHADGAPPWAVITDGEPALAPRGISELNLYVNAAQTSFWLNRVPSAAPQGASPGPGIQDHYIGAMIALARRFRNDSTVVGYDIMNEPAPGAIPLGAFSTAVLFPFYAKVIATLTGPAVGANRQSFWFEPPGVRNITSAPDQLALPFTTYPNLVYSPHVYTHVFSADALLGIPNSPYPLSYDQPYQVADAEARSMHAALMVGEYGDSAAADETYLRSETAAQDRAQAGSAIYAWKGGCGAGANVSDCEKAWTVYAGDPATPPAQNIGLVTSRLKFLSRAYPRATAGRLDSYTYDPDRRTFTMTATATRAGQETVVFIPYTATGNVTAAGHARVARVDLEPDGTRLAYASTTGPGEYSVALG